MDPNATQPSALVISAYAPATSEARATVDALIRNEWLRRRYLRIETAIWNEQFNKTDSPSLTAAFDAAADPLCRVGRRQNIALRDYIRALKQLELHGTKSLNPELVSFLISKRSASHAPKSGPSFLLPGDVASRARFNIGLP
jgi:hypothetical protein